MCAANYADDCRDAVIVYVENATFATEQFDDNREGMGRITLTRYCFITKGNIPPLMLKEFC